MSELGQADIAPLAQEQIDGVLASLLVLSQSC